MNVVRCGGRGLSLHLSLALLLFGSWGAGQDGTGEIVVTATKTPRSPRDVPGVVSVLGPAELHSVPWNHLDGALRGLSGVNVRRLGGFDSVRPVVTLRGLGGDDAGRCLVLWDGVPLNTADSGDVNWRLPIPALIDQVEVYRSPASSLHGNHAMGGVIHLITAKPTRPLAGVASAAYGSHETVRAAVRVGGRSATAEGSSYWQAYGAHLDSGGYKSVPPGKRDAQTVKRYAEQSQAGLRLGYESSGATGVEVAYAGSSDTIGEGVKIRARDGVHRDYETLQSSVRCWGETAAVKWEATAFRRSEDYARLSESLRGSAYTRYDVQSERIDQGALLSLTRSVLDRHTVTLGADARDGRVDAADVYRTSSDVSENRGKMWLLAGYVQDEVVLPGADVRLLAGLRYDYADVHDGYAGSTDPLWSTYGGGLEDGQWDQVSPRLGLRWRPGPELSGYVSYARGFRAPPLDDLCRSGWTRLGPKEANPLLEAETVDTYEMGADLAWQATGLRLSSAAFYTSGRDFLYYIDTGRTLSGTRRVWRRENVGRVSVYGFELDLTWDVGDHLRWSASYTRNESEITSFHERPELEGRQLTYAPRDKAAIAAELHASGGGVRVACVYKGRQYADDLNTERIDGYGTVDIGFWRDMAGGVRLSVGVENVLDEEYLESEDSLGPGRVTTGSVACRF